MPERILIVDDEKGIRTTLRGILEDEGFDVEAVGSGERCLEVARNGEFELVILDVWLPEMDGLEVLEQLKKEGNPAQVIMISGHGTVESAVRATRLGAWDFIEKPLSLDKTVLVVRNAMRQRQLERENVELQRRLAAEHEMVGESKAMRRLRSEIELAAPSDSRVLIFGENGTGKELVARAIHRGSARAEGPFVEVNCAAIPDELIESELFGHKKGSFTGASEDKVGKFQAADGGTLFLDEIGDMSLKTQAKVLRALQEQRIEPVGGNRSVSVNVRVIVATNKNLEEEIGEGRFRKDLYFRINVIPVRVPPLRERRDDIPLLAEHFLKDLAERFGRKPKEFEAAVLDMLKRHDWPGNVRELRNTIERLMIMVPGETIGAEDLAYTARGSGEEPVEEMEFDSLKEAREYFERMLISSKLAQLDYNVAETAKALKIERSHLYRKLKAYGIEIGGVSR
ncbi:MAG TPA: sigma-54 dependent transcriptional regulator [Acidobacteriota bacterium]|nr:sigma-54 dependent transcriptional regulator [Acidobacteriota bacterium]